MSGIVTGTAAGQLLGWFDSSCALVSSARYDTRLMLNVPSDGVVIVAASQVPDYEFTGGGVGDYSLSIVRLETIGSIFGSLADEVTGAPIGATVTLELSLIHI